MSGDQGEALVERERAVLDELERFRFGLAEELRCWRWENQWSQADVAESLGIPRPNVSRLEAPARADNRRGAVHTPTLETVVRVAHLMGVEPGELVRAAFAQADERDGVETPGEGA